MHNKMSHFFKFLKIHELKCRSIFQMSIKCAYGYVRLKCQKKQKKKKETNRKLQKSFLPEYPQFADVFSPAHSPQLN